MTWNKKRILGIATALVMVVSMTGCKFNISTGNTYKDSEKYTVGNTTYDASNINEIEINWICGSVTVIESDKNVLEIKEDSESLPEAQQIHSYADGNVLRLQFCESGYIKHIEPNNKNLVVEIPANCKIEINDVSANVNLKELSAKEIEFNAVSGDLKADSLIVEGKIDTNTTSGNIDLSNVEAERLGFNTVSGDLEIPVLSVDKLDMTSVSGNMNISVESVNKISLDTTSGDFVIDIPEDFGLTLSKSSVSGKVMSNLEFTKSNDNFVFGSGETKVSFNSVSGDISIK